MSVTTKDEGQGVETECEHCGYTWDYTGEMWKATCPNCGRKTKTPHAEED
jgi:rubrerythrin